jgi:hypothetical protein
MKPAKMGQPVLCTCNGWALLFQYVFLKGQAMKFVSINVTNHVGFLSMAESLAGKWGVFLTDDSPEDYTGDSEKRVGLFNSFEEAEVFASLLHEAMPKVSVLMTL